MNLSAIYSKTGKGVQEASGKTRELARADRAVLAAIDGKSTVAEVGQKLGKPPSDPKFLELFQQLDRSGFIRLIAGGEVAPTKPPTSRAGPAPAPTAEGDLDFTQSLSRSRIASATAGKPVVDAAAQARTAVERKAKEEAEAKAKGEREAAQRAEAEAKARAEAEARAKADSEARARRDSEHRSRAESELLAKIAEAERLAKEAEDRVRTEAVNKAKRETEALRERLEAERKAKEEAERKAREEAERKAKEEAERKAREEAERRAKEEAERKAREESERKAQEEAERKAREEAERQAREEAERRAKEESERRAKEEAERRAREEAERKAKEESERRAREEAERRAKEEAERKAKEEAERKAKEEAERKAQEEAERRAREEAERKAREEAERRAREEAERKAREEAERMAREEAERNARERAEREAREREQAVQPAKAAGEVDLSATLLADLDSFAQHEEEERKAREEAEARRRSEQERKAREEAEARKRSEQERQAREQAEARKRREEEERAKREAEQVEPPRTTTSQPGGEEARFGERRRSGKAKRRLAAIVASDIVGYSRLMGIDEEGTLERFRRILNEIVRPKVEECGGRIFKTAGDGLLLEFPSVVEAARWAADVQTAVASDQAGQSPARQISFRMGVNLGDVIDEDNDLFGDGVNVAARLEGLAERGGVCVSGVVYDHIHDKVSCKFEDLGPQKLKNIARPVRVYRMHGEWETVSLRRSTDLQSLPHSTAMAGTARAREEIEVAEEDLDMEEVKRDEQALSPEARKAAREREREKQRLAKAAAAEARARRYRPPRKWGKPVAIGALLLVAGGVAAVQFMPVSTAQYERAASEALGTRVTIREARMSVFSGLKLKFAGVTIGDAVTAREASATADLGSLFGSQKSLSSVELDDVIASPAALGATLFGALKSDTLGVHELTLKRVQLSGPLALPPLDAEISIDRSGTARSAVVRAPGDFSMQLVRKGDQFDFDATASSFAPPFIPVLAMSNYAMKGSVTRSGMDVTHFDAQLYEGTISGDARIRWREGWKVEGSVQVRTLNAGVLAPALLSQGTADANGSYSMQAADPAKLLGGAHLEGHFTISKGVLGSFDLAKAIRTKGDRVNGLTTFARMSGEGSYDAGTVALRNIAIGAGALSAGASAQIAPNGALTGRIIADVKTQAQTLSATLNLAGTVKAPKVSGK